MTTLGIGQKLINIRNDSTNSGRWILKNKQWKILFTFNLAIGIFFLISLFQKITVDLPNQIEFQNHIAKNPLYPEHPVDSHDPKSILPTQEEPTESILCKNFYKAVCQKRGLTRDPTGTVLTDAYGEIMALRTYEEIIHKHPDWTSDQVDEELVRMIYTAKARNRINSAFRWVVYHFKKLIERQPNSHFKDNEKRLLRERLERTELQLPPPASVYADEPDLFSKNDVFYERTYQGDLRLRVGGAYLISAKSWFNNIFTLAHELAHAIDPCEVKNANLSFKAYDQLSSCFEKKKWILPLPHRFECGKNDQFSETFSDWIAVELLHEALKEFSKEFKGSQIVSAIINAVRDLCEQDEQLLEVDTDQHLTPKLRIEALLGQHPGIRQILGCKINRYIAKHSGEYCRFGGEGKVK